MTLKFTPGNHQYRLDGRKIEGVTTLLKGYPKPALVYWSARTVAEYVADNEAGVDQLRTMGRDPMVAALKSVPWQERDVKAARGTEVHALAEQLVQGHTVEVPDHLTAMVEGYAHLLDERHIEPILVEARGANRTLWYAGTLDLLAKVDGEILLLDAKTTAGIYGETAMQTAAYAHFEFIDDDGTEMPLPAIDGIGAIHITELGSTLHRFPDMERAWKVFQHVAWVYRQMPDVDSWGTRS